MGTNIHRNPKASGKHLGPRQCSDFSTDSAKEKLGGRLDAVFGGYTHFGSKRKLKENHHVLVMCLPYFFALFLVFLCPSLFSFFFAGGGGGLCC